MRKTPLRKMSERQKARNEEWARVKQARIEYLIRVYGFPICEWSGERGNLDDPESLHFLDAHHIDHNRGNNTFENCYIVKRIYHTFITDNSIKVEQEDFQGRVK